jgi:two-component system, response regulator, stage 0 sporulation protein F
MSSKMQMLIVDDNTALREALKAVFEDEYDLSFAKDGREALVQYSQHSPQVVLMDYKMPGMDGLETLEHLRAQSPESRVVMMSAYDDMPTVADAKRRGVTDFVGKPFDVAEIRRVIDKQVQVSGSKAQPYSNAKVKTVPTSIITQCELDDMINQTLRLTCA